MLDKRSAKLKNEQKKFNRQVKAFQKKAARIQRKRNKK